MQKIMSEIDKSDVIYAPPDILQKDLEAGLVGLETASKIRGYPPDEVEKAKKDHADRLARIAQTQGLNPANRNPSQLGGNGDQSSNDNQRDLNPSSRGVATLDGELNAGKTEKKLSPIDTTAKKVRGEGK